MKIIKVEACSKCPLKHYDAAPNLYVCDLKNISITKMSSIPSWCPLEDAPDGWEEISPERRNEIGTIGGK